MEYPTPRSEDTFIANIKEFVHPKIIVLISAPTLTVPDTTQTDLKIILSAEC